MKTKETTPKNELIKPGMFDRFENEVIKVNKKTFVLKLSKKYTKGMELDIFKNVVKIEGGFIFQKLNFTDVTNYTLKSFK